MAGGSQPHGRGRATAATMILAEFLLLTWLGVTVIGDTAGRSAAIAAILTVVTVAAITWDKRRR